jgi:hypothetical protein
MRTVAAARKNVAWERRQYYFLAVTARTQERSARVGQQQKKVVRIRNTGIRPISSFLFEEFLHRNLPIYRSAELQALAPAAHPGRRRVETLRSFYTNRANFSQVQMTTY